MKVMIVKIEKDGRVFEGTFNYKYYHDTFREENIIRIAEMAYPNDFICDIKEKKDDSTGIC